MLEDQKIESYVDSTQVHRDLSILHGDTIGSPPYIYPSDFVGWVVVSKSDKIYAEAHYIGLLRTHANGGVLGGKVS